MRYTKSLRVTPQAFLLAGVFFAVWIALLLVQAPAAEAEDVLGWTGTIRYTKSWTGEGQEFPETGSQTTTYNVDGTVPPGEQNGIQYQPATWAETFSSRSNYQTSCDTIPVTTSYITRSGSGSGNTGLLVHFGGTRYQIDAGFHGNNADFSNMQYYHTRSYCDKSEQLPVSAQQVVVGHFNACNWDVASTPEGSAATTLSGTATNPCPLSPGVTETYEWNLTREPNPPEADIGVTQTDSPDPVITGGNVKYTVIVRNYGPDDATDVKLSDTIPQGTTYVSATPSTGTCSLFGGTVDCLLGSLASGASATVDIVVTAPGSEGTLTNAASASAAEMDPQLANNNFEEITTVNPQPPSGDTKNLQLSASKTSRGGASVGFTEDYAFQYSKNTGTKFELTGSDYGNWPNQRADKVCLTARWVVYLLKNTQRDSVPVDWDVVGQPDDSISVDSITLRSSALTWTSCRTDGGTNHNLLFGQSGGPTFIADSDQKIGRIGHTLTYTAYRNGREVASVSTSDSATVFKK